MLDCSKNDLSDLNSLNSEQSFQKLEIVIATHNKLPIQYLDDLCIIIRSLPSLLELNLSGNEIMLNKTYKPKILTTKKLKKLDGIQIRQEMF